MLKNRLQKTNFLDTDFTVQLYYCSSDFFIMTELGKLFPSIPFVAEEDSAFLVSNNLVDSVVNVVTDKESSRDKPS